jgi:polyferredoxin
MGAVAASSLRNRRGTVTTRVAEDGAAPAEPSGSYFAKHQKIYPRIVHGRFAQLRVVALFLTLGVLYALPWLRWDDRQAFLLDLPHRKFYLFGLVLWPQDLIYLTALFVLLALTLFVVTALAGRVWCGYACPQTVFTQIVVWIERWVEGDRQSQIRLARSGTSWGKLWRRTVKWTLWTLFAAWTAFSAVGLFVPIHDLGQRAFALALGPWEMVFLALFAGAVLLFAGSMREQVCTYMCPYARFQSAMFDRHTLVISYDAARGEPRGAARRPAAGLAAFQATGPGGATTDAVGPTGGDLGARVGLPGAEKSGDCVACTLCVQACPTGIDIREGLQYQCIACTSCIDACDEVMDKLGRPRGLIRYTTQHALEGRGTRILRPRVLAYLGLMLVIATALGVSLANRVPLELDVLRDRNAAYREARGGRIENVYRLKILNMDERARSYLLRASGPTGISVEVASGELAVPAGEVRDVAVRVQVAPEELHARSTEIALELVASDDPAIAVRETTRFLGPRPEVAR